MFTQTKVATGNVFISYRREDTAGYAGRIYDRLNARFPNRVFMDVTRLDPGVDFVEEIQKAVGSCRVLIVLIGKHWAVSDDGTPRLQDPNDFVRLEVGHALERKIRVIPILVGGASIPTTDVLPPEIGALLRRQVLKLDDSAFDYNVNQLIEVIEKDLGVARKSPNEDQRETPPHAESRETGSRPQEPRTVYVNSPPVQKKSRKWLWIGVGAVAAIWLVIAVIGAILDEVSNSIDPQATAALLNAIQSANTGGNTAQNSAGPASSLNTAAAETDPAVAPAADQPAATFNPVGRWRVSLGQNGSLVLTLTGDGSFQAQTEGAGLSFPASAGGWTYDASTRVLTTTGVNNVGAFFQAIFQIREFDGTRAHAFVPGQGNVVLTRE
jgi:hypothetical protein